MTTELHVSFNDDYTASAYAFDTTRKSAAIAASLVRDPIPGVRITDPRGFFGTAEDTIGIIHSTDYVTAVRTGSPEGLAASQGFTWDPGVYTMAVSHSAGLIAATARVLEHGGIAGSLSSGLHHTSHGSGKGYCTFNGLAAAVFHARSLGAERVLVLDFDAHSGGGTWDIISRVLPGTVHIDVTCSAYDTFTPEGESSNWYTGHQDYVTTIESALLYASKKLDPFDLVVYNAGMDPLNCGVTESDIVQRERAVREFIGETPAVFALAGGYTWGKNTMDDVVRWHRHTLAAWAV